jgi:hypothetical protein
MTLLLTDLLERLPPYFATRETPADEAMALVRLYDDQSGWEWFPMELDREDGDTLYGYCFSGYTPDYDETGTSSLSILLSLRHEDGAAAVKVDPHFTPRSLSELRRDTEKRRASMRQEEWSAEGMKAAVERLRWAEELGHQMDVLLHRPHLISDGPLAGAFEAPVSERAQPAGKPKSNDSRELSRPRSTQPRIAERSRRLTSTFKRFASTVRGAAASAAETSRSRGRVRSHSRRTPSGGKTFVRSHPRRPRKR